MRIVIDVNGIADGSGGLGNYLRMFVSHLASVDAVNEYVLYLHQWKTPDFAALDWIVPKQHNFKVLWHRMPNSLSLFAEYKFGLGVTELMLGGGATVFHGPSNTIPLLRTMKSVITLHHFTRVGDPQLRNRLGARARFHLSVSEMAVKTADRVIAVSESTRRDIIEKIGVPAERISVSYPGEPRPAFRVIDGAALPPRFLEKIPGRYVLFAGPVNERKNLPAFLEAFASVKDELSECRLAITGRPTPKFARSIESTAGRLGLRDRVALLGAVTDDELSLLYNRAECLAYPSLIEGFGTPPIEAMACGCPVIASNATSIPEVTGGAALLFDGTDARSMAAALLRVTRDQPLRDDLIAKGLVRIKAFSWRRMAEEHVEIYRRVAAEKKR